MAAGAVPRRMASASTADEEDDPRPPGMTRTVPATLRPRSRVGAIDDAAGFDVDAAPQTQRIDEDEGRRVSASGSVGLRGSHHDAPPVNRTTRPAAADAMQSSSSPNATCTPRLPGA